jgi:poly(ADP-ribose) glycohydrolase ARH3
LLTYPDRELWYTDDTQMTLGVAQTLIAHGEIVEAALCQSFVANYMPSRGYGRGTRAVIEAMEDGRDYRAVATRYFPGGSNGNGAAMRVAPVGLFFHDSAERLRDEAHKSATPTHLHPLGIEGAQLLAMAIGICTSASDRGHLDKLLPTLHEAATSDEYRDRLRQAMEIENPPQLSGLGNGIQALESVPTAIASFALSPEDYGQAIAQTILIGGDTDTLAAMTGALSGAYLGLEGIPPRLTALLERSPQGYDFLVALADQLHDRWLAK